MAGSCTLLGISALAETTCSGGFINTTCACPPEEFFLAKLFVDVNNLPAGFFGFAQLMWLFIFYALVLYQGSNLISDGSELLLLVPEYISSELVGSIVLPILGAVPDGAIVLFSGLGPDAQNQLNVGIGGLAGSTIMLLTIPWFLSIYAGRVDTDRSGIPKYRKGGRRLTAGAGVWLGSGVAPKVRNMVLSGRIMFVTAMIYLVIQIPAFIFISDDGENATKKISEAERWWAFTGMILCIILFCVYLWFQAKLADDGDHHSSDKNDFKKQALQEAEIASGQASIAAFLEEDRSGRLLDAAIAPSTEALLKENFKKYDLDGNGEMDEQEMGLMLADLNIVFSQADLKEAFAIVDEDGDGSVQFREFLHKIRSVVSLLVQRNPGGTRIQVDNPTASVQVGADDDDDDDDGDDEPEVPEDLAGITDRSTLAKTILFRSCWMMLLGTAMVLLFSDPMVDVFSAFGERLNIGAFYVSFVLAPLASNASELIAAYNYAQKKTSTTITTSLTALQGAACMNNTFCLGIFMALIYFKSLLWEFSAETISIVVVQVVMVVYSLKRYHFMRDAWIVLALYPLSLIIVFVLENSFNMK
jgi:Ca2+/Na+ antiporter